MAWLRRIRAGRFDRELLHLTDDGMQNGHDDLTAGVLNTLFARYAYGALSLIDFVDIVGGCAHAGPLSSFGVQK
jgi:hypothetical protein